MSLRRPLATDRSTGIASELPATDLLDPAAQFSADRYLMQTGALFETLPRSRVASSAVATTSGTGRGAAVGLPQGMTISSLTYFNGSTASATVTHEWAALLDAAGVVLAVSPDDTNTWATNAAKTFTFAAAVTLAASGLYYVFRNCVASTMPTPVGQGIAGSTSTGTPLVAVQSAGLSTPPAVGSTIPLTGLNQIEYAYGS